MVMGIVRVEYIVFVIDDDKKAIMQCVNDLADAILKEEKLKELGYNLDFDHWK